MTHKANALILVTRHIEESLELEYTNEKSTVTYRQRLKNILEVFVTPTFWILKCDGLTYTSLTSRLP